METILFLIIAGVLSTIFSKGKSKGTTSAKKPFSTKSMKEIRNLFTEFTNNEMNKTRPIKSDIKADSHINNLKTLEQEYQQVRQESESSRMGIAASRQQAEKTNERSIKSKLEENEAVNLEKPDANTLVNGIIWSEILGEPRSKNPYRAKRR